jgi:hypothetical protein
MAGAGAEPGAGSSAGEATWDGLAIAAEDPRGSTVAVRRFDDAGETRLGSRPTSGSGEQSVDLEVSG